MRVDYYLDGSFFNMHQKAKAEVVPAAWGVDTDCQPVFLGLGSGASESPGAWGSFLENLKGQGLRLQLRHLRRQGAARGHALPPWPHSRISRPRATTRTPSRSGTVS